jgi:hypothetical protein
MQRFEGSFELRPFGIATLRIDPQSTSSIGVGKAYSPTR